MTLVTDIMKTEVRVISREIADHLAFLDQQGADPAKLRQLSILYRDATQLDNTLINEIGHASPVENDGE